MEIALGMRRRAPTLALSQKPVAPHDATGVRPGGCRGRRGRLVLGVAVVAARCGELHPTGAQAAVEAHAVSLSLDWTQTLNDAGGPIAESSPNVATLAGGPAVVVGDRAGHVYAFNLASGAGVPGWPVSTGGVPVDSTPSVADTAGNGLDSVFVGEGNAATPTSGGYLGITPQGTTSGSPTCRTRPPTRRRPRPCRHRWRWATSSGGTDVVAGSLGEVGQAMNAANGAMLAWLPLVPGRQQLHDPGPGRRLRQRPDRHHRGR